MGKGKAAAGLVLGILGIIFGILSGYFSIIGLPVAIVGLILSVSAGKQLRAAGQPSGLTTAGLVLGIIAVVFTTIAFFSCILCASAGAGSAAGLLESLY